MIESFRNNLWTGYKTSEGVESDLLSQFPILEETLAAAGITVWPMVEFEADDAKVVNDKAHNRQRRISRTKP